MSKYLIAGNWKMNTDLDKAKKLILDIIKDTSQIDDVDILMCPPFTHLYYSSQITADSNISIGAQNSYFESNGAFTGEISNDMLISAGCRYVILGHSERRSIFDESNELINKKVISALDSGLNVILCIGESDSDRDSGNTNNVLFGQLEESLKNITKYENITIAYEPVWAIGTGKTATPELILETHEFINTYLNNRFGNNNIKILYGGSMNSENAESILNVKNVSGGLIGGASLKAESFSSICKIASKLS
ncbi:MAG: triose-phosphate isomerase [Chlorobiota bacterium]